MTRDGGGGGYGGFYVDPQWPGLEVKDGVEVHHSSVKNLLKALEDDITGLRGVGSGTVQHLRVYGKVTPGHVGEWDAAQQLNAVFTQGHTSITTSYENLIAQYEAALAVIRTSFDNIVNADKASDVNGNKSA
ncbi:MAG: hypothetical protein JWQ95_5025 [Sphaerisporangium sp.]|jgi:hypothetical protein|nr:hypothetical protein [Sphaerisporangium sp.]